MSSYESFARVYDLFMDNIPYEEWCGYLTGLLEDQGIRDGLVLELGCGTGNMTRLLAGKGYDMIGVDNSVDMLEIAMEKKEEEGQDILYLLQDMREFELYGTVRAVVSVCDSMNYITEEEDLLEVFRLVNNYLDPGGIFIFDLNTEYEETHYQKAYSLEKVKELLLKAGMEFVAAYDAFTRDPVREDSERIYILAREKGKNKQKEEN